MTKHPVGRRKKTEALWTAFIQGNRRDRGLRDALCEVYFPLMQSFANGYARASRLDPDDVASWTSMGLVAAVERYDPSKGSFRRYARRCMRMEVLRSKAAEYRRRGSAGEMPQHVSFSESLGVSAEDEEEIRYLLSCLGQHRRDIVKWHLYDGLTFKAIAAKGKGKRGWSESNISLRFQDALKRMKDMATKEEEP